MKEGKCIDCGKRNVGTLSIHGLCQSCAYARQRNAVSQIRNKAGPVYEKWKEGLKRSVE